MLQLPRPNISPERKGLYLAGNILVGVGIVLFLSTFLSFACMMGGMSAGPSMLESARVVPWIFGRAVFGFILIIAGNAIRMVAAKGIAGSGMTLDPEQTRKDVEPWSRLSGQILNDTLSEVEPIQKIAEALSQDRPAVREVIKVRCRHCGALDDEDAKFCSQCGKEM